jgi:signal peptidase I
VIAALAAARVIPMVVGAPAFVVGGGSMEPSIHLGSIVIDGPVATADLDVGDIVSIKVGPEQTVFTHRITRIITRDGVPWIETRGDANQTVDPSTIPATAVVGRVAVVVPGLGYVVQLLASFAGMAFLVSLGMLTLLGAWLLEILEDDQRAARGRWLVPAGGAIGFGDAIGDGGAAG